MIKQWVYEEWKMLLIVGILVASIWVKIIIPVIPAWFFIDSLNVLTICS